jgi:hypothetical protein
MRAYLISSDWRRVNIAHWQWPRAFYYTHPRSATSSTGFLVVSSTYSYVYWNERTERLQNYKILSSYQPSTGPIVLEPYVQQLARLTSVSHQIRREFRGVLYTKNIFVVHTTPFENSSLEPLRAIIVDGRWCLQCVRSPELHL